jgi:hypothetical protein
MSKAEKKFDAVAMMRAARDKISAEIEGMTLEEELRWLASQELDDPFLRRLRERAAQQADQRPGLRPAADRQGVGQHREALLRSWDAYFNQ